MGNSPRRTGKPESVEGADIGRDDPHPSLIALVRLVARSAAASDFVRAEAKREAGHDEAD